MNLGCPKFKVEELTFWAAFQTEEELKESPLAGAAGRTQAEGLCAAPSGGRRPPEGSPRRPPAGCPAAPGGAGGLARLWLSGLWEGSGSGGGELQQLGGTVREAPRPPGDGARRAGAAGGRCSAGEPSGTGDGEVRWGAGGGGGSPLVSRSPSS